MTALVLDTVNAEVDGFLATEQSIKDRKKEIFYGLIELILTTTSIKCLSFVGTTPGFNDGDPCYHSEDCWIFTESPLGEQPEDEDEDSEDEDDDDYEEIDYSSEEGSVWIRDLEDKDTAEPLWDLLHKCNYGILEDKHETDYCVKFYLGLDGKVVEDYDYCDRGY